MVAGSIQSRISRPAPALAAGFQLHAPAAPVAALPVAALPAAAQPAAALPAAALPAACAQSAADKSHADLELLPDADMDHYQTCRDTSGAVGSLRT